MAWHCWVTIDVSNEVQRKEDMKFTKLTDHLKLAADKLVGFKPEPY
ncbi:hypothetical protein YpAngola_0055 (plasmid) [Yersinia pestis Angola]|nr:hypothetical protein YpAngola_0055 [Yersinia pestis Angola]